MQDLYIHIYSGYPDWFWIDTHVLVLYCIGWLNTFLYLVFDIEFIKTKNNDHIPIKKLLI